MSKLIKVVLIGPTGAGKSQFCNFIHKDLTNSIHEVSDSLNSCTTEPKSTIVQRPNIRLELIDSPGSSDSNNDDEENLTILVKYLRNKKEINQIFLVLSFENRFTGDTKKFLSILGWIFTPIQFMINLMIIFTHYPDKPDEDDINKFTLLEKEINEELNKIFEIPIECKMPKIPVYYINTKIFKNEGILYFDKISEEMLNKIIKELKIRVNTNNAIINTTDLNYIKGNKTQLEKKLKEIKSLKDKYLSLKNEVQKIIIRTQIYTSKHFHGVVLLYANNDWICEICKSQKAKNESKYHCSLCDYNICKNCIENNSRYPLDSYEHKQLYLKKYKFPNHEHELLFCRSSRFNHELNYWNCDLCRRLFTNRVWSFYCTFCDYDMCIICAKNKICLEEYINVFGIKISSHDDPLVYMMTNKNYKCQICLKEYGKTQPTYYCSDCDFNVCVGCKNKFNNEQKYNLFYTERNMNSSFELVEMKCHNHPLIYSLTQRTNEPTSWICNNCSRTFGNRDWSFYCTRCDYDLCFDCYNNMK